MAIPPGSEVGGCRRADSTDVDGNIQLPGGQGYRVLGILGAVFAAVGLGFLVLGIGADLYDARRMDGWRPVPGALQHLEVVSRRSDNSTVYKLEARYTYTYQGRRYHGSRVGIHTGADNIGTWHQDTYRRLRAARPLTVWVNPRDPAEAVLVREPRPEMLAFKGLFVLVFGGIGAGMLYWSRRQRRRAREAAGHPPWLARPEWRENRIPSQARSRLAVAWFLAVLWNALSAPLWIAIPERLARGDWMMLFAAAFPLIGIGLLVWALRETRAWQRFGDPRLVLDPFPARVGATLEATADTRIPYRGGFVVQAQLACTRVVTTGYGKHRSTRRTVVWEDTRPASVLPGRQGSLVSVRFDIPAHLPSTEPVSSDYHEWRLRLTAQLPGVDFDRRFSIPVAPAEGRAAVAANREERSDTGPPPERIAEIRRRLRRVAAVAGLVTGIGFLVFVYFTFRRVLDPLVRDLLRSWGGG